MHPDFHCNKCCMDCEASEEEKEGCKYLCKDYIDNPICKYQQTLSRSEYFEREGDIVCDFCGENMLWNERNEFNEYSICNECWEDYIVECSQCHRYVDTEDDYVVYFAPDGYYCSECTAEHLLYCDNCGEYDRRESMEIGETYTLCQNCYAELTVVCEGCNQIIFDDDSMFADGHYYCVECYNERYFVCDNCSEDIGRNDMNTYESSIYGTMMVCNHCLELLVSDEEE